MTDFAERPPNKEENLRESAANPLLFTPRIRTWGKAVA